MKQIILLAFLFCAGALAAPPPEANPNVPELLVADGSSSGTYQAFVREIAQVTGDVITLKEVPSSGAVENLDKLINNQVSAAFMHNDVILHRSKSNANLAAKFKTLIALFKEEVHFVAMSQSRRTTGGVLGFGKKSVEVADISDLRGMRVGAAGGGYVTAQVVRLQSEIAYEVQEYKTGKDVLAALDKGEIDAAVFVGGAPLPNLAGLGPDYKILPIADREVAKLKEIYSPASVTYTKMRPDSVQTVAADALLVARDYTKTPRLINQLKLFRSTFFSRLGELQETPGLHPKWQEVTADERGKWIWLDLP